jgi:NADH-quinone oxidoreductase subunit G
MPKIVIDDQEIEVPPGTRVIDAAERLGIMIPRFCFHPALGSVGACRVCAVMFLGGPVKGVNMSCMVEAREGMLVSTTHKEAMDFRKQVIEWLMLHHPHDCPVCDEGGHCLLQDLTVAGGHGIRRYLGKKRTYLDQDLGPLVQHEMNRCIHCWRCRRFYQDFTGYRDLGAMQIANRTYFGRFSDGPLESPFAGNLIDMCPTGVYTDKPSRYKGRRWDYERVRSLCIHCSLGCRVVASARYREMIRLEAGHSDAVNGYFICDRGRYGFGYANLPERPRRGRIGAEEVAVDQGIRASAHRLFRIREGAGGEAVAAVGSGRNSLETQAMLWRLSRACGWRGPWFTLDAAGAGKVRAAVRSLDADLAVSMREIERSDFVLGVGVDPVNEAPMLALAIRQAHRNGGSVSLIDPRPIFLPLLFDHVAVPPEEMERCLGVVVKRAVDRSAVENVEPNGLAFHDALPGQYEGDRGIGSLLEVVSQRLRSSRKPVIVCGADMIQASTVSLASDLVRLLRAVRPGAGLFCVLPHANDFGAGLLSSASDPWELLEAMESRAVTALLVVESDPLGQFPDRERMTRALEKLDFLLVMDYLNSETVRRADAFLPTQTLFECGGTFVNQEGRAQSSPPVHRGGMPILQIGGGGHPPRVFGSEIPGGEPEPAHGLLARLGEILAPGSDWTPESLWGILAQENPLFARLEGPEEPWEGIRLVRDRETPASFGPGPGAWQRMDGNAGEGLDLFLVDWTYGTEELSGYSAPTQGVEPHPTLLMHSDDAACWGLANGDRVAIHLEQAVMEADLVLARNMARGAMFLPRHRRLDWQKLSAPRVRIPPQAIKKA